MADFIKTQNSFANGEVGSEFYVHDGINGLSKLENMDVLSGGGLTRRSGLRTVCALPGAARLISFSVSDGEEYLIALTDGHMYIYRDDKKYQDLITPWTYDDLSHVQYAQRFGTMIFVHPNFIPQVLRKSGDRFYISDFYFSRNDADMTLQVPFVSFDDTTDISITVTSCVLGNNYATFTTNLDFWTPDNVNGRLFLLERQWVVHEYISPTQIIAYTNGTYSIPSSPVTDWRESAFSARRGWPRSITFHQDRLVFGGSRDWPSGIWMSQVGRHNNFDIGTGLDDEAIFVSLMSQQRQHICATVSSDNLQILTNVGEWAISNSPLTPSAVDVKQHTSVGSYVTRHLPPQTIEGATIFVAANGCDIRELGLDELGENYRANDLSAFSKHIMHNPIDMAYNSATRKLYVVRTDGIMAVLNQNTALGISAWGTYTTSGRFISVSVCDKKTYIVVSRGDDVFLEYFDVSALRDCDKYDFSFTASGIPLRSSGHSAARLRLRKISARVLQTKSLNINSHRITLPNEIYTIDSPGFSGDVSINLLGTVHDCMNSPWTIHGTDPQPATILSVTMHGWYSV